MEKQIIIPSHPNYTISNYGRIRNIKKDKIMLQSTDEYGYKKLTLSHKGKEKTFKVHKLVAEAFHLNPDGKPTVNHKDGQKDNNYSYNLGWATHQEQYDHSIKQGLRDLTGENSPSYKITDSQVSEIRQHLEEGKLTGAAISRLYGVSSTLIYRIRDNKTRKI